MQRGRGTYNDGRISNFWPHWAVDFMGPSLGLEANRHNDRVSIWKFYSMSIVGADRYLWRRSKGEISQCTDSQARTQQSLT